MRIKLSHLIIVSLITLSIVFSVIGNANAKTCAERYYAFNKTCETFEGKVRTSCYTYSFDRYKYCLCKATNPALGALARWSVCGLQPDPGDYGFYVIEIATPLEPTTSYYNRKSIIDSGGTSGGGSVYEEPMTSTSYPPPIIDNGGTSGGGSVYVEPKTSSSYPSPIINRGGSGTAIEQPATKPTRKRTTIRRVRTRGVSGK